MCSLLVLQILWLFLFVPIIQGHSLPPGHPTELGGQGCIELETEIPHLEAISASPAPGSSNSFSLGATSAMWLPSMGQM